VKNRLKALARWMAEEIDSGVKVFVDTAPVMEKPLGQQAGLGWQGKHTNLVSRGYGSWLFLGEVYSTLDLAPDTSEIDHCGSCTRCLTVCPTDAFPAPYQLDARRCISYLTIEHKGVIAREFRVPMGNRIYGCDDCLAVCPWNKYASPTGHDAFLPRAELMAPRLADLAQLDDTGFRQLFSGSPVKRIGRDRFVRNVLIAIGNSGSQALVPITETLLADESPLVRGMAVWALSRLLDAGLFAALRETHLPTETDEDVRAEWKRPNVLLLPHRSSAFTSNRHSRTCCGNPGFSLLGKHPANGSLAPRNKCGGDGLRKLGLRKKPISSPVDTPSSSLFSGLAPI
jgi:epoxyqueuosine reductase